MLVCTFIHYRLMTASQQILLFWRQLNQPYSNLYQFGQYLLKSIIRSHPADSKTFLNSEVRSGSSSTNKIFFLWLMISLTVAVTLQYYLLRYDVASRIFMDYPLRLRLQNLIALSLLYDVHLLQYHDCTILFWSILWR
jgi:hypothetical protein